MLNQDTCKANKSIITTFLSAVEGSVNCSTHTDPDGQAFSSTTLIITEGESSMSFVKY